MNDKTPVVITDEQIRFRFFKDLNAEQRLAVFKAFGVYPDDCTESLNHGIEYRLLKRILNRAALSCASPADKPVDERMNITDEICELLSTLLHFVPKDERKLYHDTELICGSVRKHGVIYADAAPVSPSPQQSESAAQQAGCPACLGTGRMVRDPDIGTDQECFTCDGSGEFEDAAPSLQQKEAALPAPRPVAWTLKWPNAKSLNIETTFPTEARADAYAKLCDGKVKVVPLYAAPLPLQEPKPVAPDVLEEARTTILWLLRRLPRVYDEPPCVLRAIASIDAALKTTAHQVSAQALPEAKDAERLVIRLTTEGALDEIVGTGPYHLEQMDDGHWWVHFEDVEGEYADVNLSAKGKIRVAFEHSCLAMDDAAMSIQSTPRAAIDAAIAAKKEKP